MLSPIIPRDEVFKSMRVFNLESTLENYCQQVFIKATADNRSLLCYQPVTDTGSTHVVVISEAGVGLFHIL